MNRTGQPNITREFVERARQDALLQGDSNRRLHEAHGENWPHDPLEDRQGPLLGFLAKEWPGFEALYRQYAAAFDEKNKNWTEGNDD